MIFKPPAKRKSSDYLFLHEVIKFAVPGKFLK